MSRSSGPGTHPTGLPQQRQQPGSAAAQTGWQQPAPQDQHGWQQPAPQAAANWPTQGHYAQQGYPVQQQPAAAPSHDPLARAPDYHYPQAADPYAQQRAAPAPAAAPRTAPPAQPQYAPQFDAYVPPSRPTAPPAQQQAYQHAQPAQPQAHAYAPPQQPAYPAAAAPRQQAHPLQGLQAAAPRAPELRGTTHDQWPQAQPQPQAYQPQSYQSQPQADTRGYDLGNYAPTVADHQQPAYEPAQPTYTQPHGDWHHQQAQHPGPQGYAQDAQAYGHAQPQLDTAGYHNEQAAGYETGQDLVAEQDYAQDDGEYEEEAPRRSKGLIIVAALIGAIGLGGGLAYAYKTFLAPSDKGKVPIVKNDRAPTKVQPPTPGGKQFANTDSKVLNGDGGKIGGRVNDGMGGGAATSASNSLDSDGTKKVQVLEVSRDGQIATPRPSIPGLIVSDGGMGPRPLPPSQPQPEAAPSPPVQPQRIVAQPRAEPPPVPAAPVVRNQAPPPSVIDAKSAAAARSVTAAAAPAVKQPVATTKTTTSSPGVGSGWVAVLASQRSQGEALQAFADLKQKYPDLLQNRQPGVQEANLGEKGVYHRLVAGPAGSKDDASALCMQLKASGHASCWVTAVK